MFHTCKQKPLCTSLQKSGRALTSVGFCCSYLGSLHFSGTVPCVFVLELLRTRAVYRTSRKSLKYALKKIGGGFVSNHCVMLLKFV